jgi:hypothetical protein
VRLWPALLLVACAPRVLWSSVDPARTVEVQVLASRHAQWVQGADAPAARFDAVGKDAVVVSDDGGHVAYAARRNGRWYVVTGARTDGPFDGVSDLTMTADGAHVAFAAQAKDRWRAVVDGAAGPAFARIRGGSFRLSGRHHAYIAVDRACSFAVVDGEASACWPRLVAADVSDDGAAIAVVRDSDGERFMLGADSSVAYEAIGDWAVEAGRSAFTAKRSGAWRAVIDGEESQPCQHIGRPHFGDGARRVAYTCDRAVVVDAEKGATWAEVRALTLAREGSTFAYVARDPDGEWVVSNDGMSGPFAHVEELKVPARGGPVTFVARADGLTRIVHGDRGEAFPLVIAGSLTVDGPHWAAITGDLEKRKLWLTIDGKPARELTVADVTRDSHYGPWMARELQRSTK